MVEVIAEGIFGNFAGANPALCVYKSNTAMHCMEDGTPEDINAISTSTEAVNKKYSPSEWFMRVRKNIELIHRFIIDFEKDYLML